MYRTLDGKVKNLIILYGNNWKIELVYCISVTPKWPTYWDDKWNLADCQQPVETLLVLICWLTVDEQSVEESYPSKLPKQVWFCFELDIFWRMPRTIEYLAKK